MEKKERVISTDQQESFKLALVMEKTASGFIIPVSRE